MRSFAARPRLWHEGRHAAVAVTLASLAWTAGCAPGESDLVAERSSDAANEQACGLLGMATLVGARLRSEPSRMASSVPLRVSTAVFRRFGLADRNGYVAVLVRGDSVPRDRDPSGFVQRNDITSKAGWMLRTELRCSERFPAPAPRSPAVWSDFPTPLAADVRARLFRLMAERNIDLILAFRPERQLGADDGYGLVEDPDGGIEQSLSVFREAVRAGVSVRVWPLLGHRMGVWANQRNADAFVEWAETVLDAVRAEEASLNLDALSSVLYVDLEMGYDRVQRLAKLTDPCDRIEYLASSISTRGLQVARDRMNELVKRAHARSFRVCATMQYTMLDDLFDGDQTFQEVQGVPFEGVSWDCASVQIYRTLLPADVRATTGLQVHFEPDLVADYAKDVRALFGDHGAVDLGALYRPAFGCPTEPSGRADFECQCKNDGYSEPRGLIEDTAAAARAGVPLEHQQFYSLEGWATRVAPERFLKRPVSSALEADLTANRRTAPSREVTWFRQIVQGLDAVLVGDHAATEGNIAADACRFLRDEIERGPASTPHFTCPDDPR